MLSRFSNLLRDIDPEFFLKLFFVYFLAYVNNDMFKGVCLALPVTPAIFSLPRKALSCSSRAETVRSNLSDLLHLARWFEPPAYGLEAYCQSPS